MSVEERLFLDPVITFCKLFRAILRFPILFIKKWFHFGFIWLIYRVDVNPVFVFVAIALLHEVDRSVLGEQSCFPYKYGQGMLIILGVSELLKSFLPDGTKGCRDGGEETY